MTPEGFGSAAQFPTPSRGPLVRVGGTKMDAAQFGDNENQGGDIDVEMVELCGMAVRVSAASRQQQAGGKVVSGFSKGWGLWKLKGEGGEKGDFVGTSYLIVVLLLLLRISP